MDKESLAAWLRTRIRAAVVAGRDPCVAAGFMIGSILEELAEHVPPAELAELLYVFADKAVLLASQRGKR